MGCRDSVSTLNLMDHPSTRGQSPASVAESRLLVTVYPWVLRISRTHYPFEGVEGGVIRSVASDATLGTVESLPDAH